VKEVRSFDSWTNLINPLNCQ